MVGMAVSDAMATEAKMAIPPSRAVGFLDQRSPRGRLTIPNRRESPRTSGVSTSEQASDRATVAAGRVVRMLSIRRLLSPARRSRVREGRDGIRDQWPAPSGGHSPLLLVLDHEPDNLLEVQRRA